MVDKLTSVPFLMPGEIILSCSCWYFVSCWNQRAFTLQMDSDVCGDSVSPNRSLFCSWMGIQIGCIWRTYQIECGYRLAVFNVPVRLNVDTDWLYLACLLD